MTLGPTKIFSADRAICGGIARGATAILVCGGEILAVGDPATIAADPRAAAAEPIHFADRALIPGTVNAHNHSFQSLLRGIGDDLPFLDWRERALYRYSPHLDADAMATAALFAFGEMLLHGITTVCDFYYLNAGQNDNAHATIAAAQKLGIRIVLARCFYDWDGAPAAYREDIPTAIRNFEALAKSTDKDRHLVTVQPAPHSQHGASPEMIRAAAGVAADAGVPWHIHLAEEKYQVDQSLERFGARPLCAIADLGVLDDRMIAIHGCWFDGTERALLSDRGAGLVYNPASNMFLGDGITDVVDLRAREVRVGLGTDGGCSNNRVSILDEMRTCALLQKVARTDGQAMAAEDCFFMGTRAGGQLLDLPIGDLAPGMRADMVALDLGDPSLWPEQALAKNVVYALSPRAITDVVVDGERVVIDRQLAGADLADIRARVRALTGTWTRD
ncbi:MAG TPA: amidohydrolase family protein [Kofleriaceae bacterium]|nr:amidohydrolase family protein [Kofleriaceae bacterium]